MVRFGSTGAATLLAALGLAGCNLSAEPDQAGAAEILEFRVERAEPPGEVVGGALAVTPRARLTFALAVGGPVEKLVLSAGERVLAELPAGATSYVDDCEVGPCGTAETGEVLYTLAAVGPGEDPSADARSLVVQVGEGTAP